MNKNTIVLYLIIISFSITSDIANAAEIPDYHKPIPCIGCHEETLGADAGPDECGNCHYYYLNVSLLESEHNPKICKGCHMGKTVINATERDIFHNGHNAVNCNTCHTQDNFTVIKIEGIEKNGYQCVTCHGNKVHVIHSINLDKICPICHGSWAKDKIYIKNSPNTSKDSGKNINLGKFTIFSFIEQLFNAIFGET